MAKFSGRIRVLLILTFLSKLTFAVPDALTDPSLEIIKQEDAEEGMYPGYNVKDQNAIPCRDPTPVNGALEVVSGIPFMINNITVKLKCLHGLEFPDGTTEKVEHCFAAPTPLRITGIWSPDQGRLVCQVHKGPNKSGKRFLESLQCVNPKTPTNKIKVLKGNPNHLYSAIEVSCPAGYHFPSGQEVINVTCLPLPDPCYCKAAWETLDQYRLIYDFNCTESLVCNDPQTPDNTVTKLDGDPYHMGSKVQVTCMGGRHFPNGVESVNVTCNPLPHPCMCLVEWMREDNFDLMNNFNCTDQDTTTKVQTPLSVELPPKDILEVDTTEVNTPVEEEETDINTQPDEQPLVEEAIPVIKSGYNVQSETKVSDENESEEHEERNDSNLKSDDLVETNNEIYDTGEHIYRKTDNPDQKIVEKNEQQDSSRSEEDATVEEDPTEEYQSENGEILQIEPEEVNLKTEYNENDLDDNNNSLQSLNQQVRPIAQSLIADEDVQTANNHVIENDIKSNEKSENSYETIEKIGYDTKENEIENVHENEEIPEDDTSVEEDMSNDITSLEEDTTENIVEEDVLEEKPFERKNVQEIFESDESASVNNGSDETEPSIPVEDKKIEDNEVNKNEQKLNNEPEEEEWGSPEVKDYQEIVENRENMRPGVVLLGETMPLNEHEISVDELQDAEKDEETENLVEIDYNEHIHGTEEEENKGEDGSQTQEKPVEEEDREEDSETEYGELQKEEEEEENNRTEELQEYNETEDEEGTEEEEETEKDSQTRENYVDAENEFEDDGEEDEDEKENEKVEEEQEEVEPPPAFYEAQNSPFHKMDEEIQPAEEDIDPCFQGPDSGFGKHAHWRFFFNSSVKECQNFLYGGIGGNANKFETLEDCLKACNTRHS